MQTAEAPHQHLKTPVEEPSRGLHSSPEEDVRELEDEDENRILCARCFVVLTHKDQRLEIQGGHTHIFSNPAGHVFEIGCFEDIEGCGLVGPATDEFTWFRGYRWRVVVCASCLTHLGWLFAAPGNGHRFAGLILDRLRFPE